MTATEKRPLAESCSTGAASESQEKHRKGDDGCVIQFDKTENKDDGEEMPKRNPTKGENDVGLESSVPAARVEEEAVLLPGLSDPEVPYTFGDSKYVLQMVIDGSAMKKSSAS